MTQDLGPHSDAAPLVSNSAAQPSGVTMQVGHVHGGINYGRRRRSWLLLLCLALAAVLLLCLGGYLVFLRPTPVRITAPAHGAVVDRCVPVTTEGRPGPTRTLIVGVYAPARDVVYPSREVNGGSTVIPVAVGSAHDRAGTAYDIVVLSAPTAFLHELRQASKPPAFTLAELAEREVTREAKITVTRKGPGPDVC